MNCKWKGLFILDIFVSTDVLLALAIKDICEPERDMCCRWIQVVDS